MPSSSKLLKVFTSCSSRLDSFITLQSLSNPSGRVFPRRHFRNGICSALSDSTHNNKFNRPLLDFVQDVEQSLQESTIDENIPRTWTKAGRRGGIYSFLQNTRPQVLGFNVSKIQERLKILESVHITGKDAFVIAFEIPSHLELRKETLKPLGDLLNNLGCNLPRLFMKAPYIFGVDFVTIQSNVERLLSVGVSSEVIGKAIDSNPLIVIYPVSTNALNIIKSLLSSCEFDEGSNNCDFTDFRQVSRDEFALRLLVQPCEGIREQVILGDNFKQVANFLREIQVSPCLMVLNNPAFFAADVDKLYQAVEFFTGRPLLFEIELIQKMMITRSEVFLNFEKEVFEERVELFKGILKTPRQLYLLFQKYFFFQGHQVELEDNIKILQKYQFQNEQIANILTAKDVFVSGESDLEKKLEFLLSLEGINVDLIADNSYCLLKPLQTLANRVAFAKEIKKHLLEDMNMEHLFMSDDEEFVTVICESSLAKYEELTGEVMSQKKPRTSQQRRKRISDAAT